MEEKSKKQQHNKNITLFLLLCALVHNKRCALQKQGEAHKVLQFRSFRFSFLSCDSNQVILHERILLMSSQITHPLSCARDVSFSTYSRPRSRVLCCTKKKTNHIHERHIKLKYQGKINKNLYERLGGYLKPVLKVSLSPRGRKQYKFRTH